MIFTIKGGSHYSDNLLYKIFNFLNFSRKMTCEVIFDQSCKYDLGTLDQLDINKLAGFSIGYHHRDSARFGWRYLNDKIEIFSYCYVSGQRICKKICETNLDESMKLEILDDDKSYIFRVFVKGVTYISKVDKKKNFSIGYKLWPYFGGNCSAPKTIKISVDYKL